MTPLVLSMALGGGLMLVRVEKDPLSVPAALQYLSGLQARLAEGHTGRAVEIDVPVGAAAGD